jgi:hypothetical protein
MNRADFQTLADVRIDEAQALLSLTPSRPDAAYYLAGYAVECALKAAIAKLVNQYDWPDKSFVNSAHTHNLSALMKAAGLEDALDIDTAGNPILKRNWLVAKDWNEQSRYQRHIQADAVKLVNAITDSTNGVLPWIKARW